MRTPSPGSPHPHPPELLRHLLAELVLEADALQEACQHNDLLTDYGLLDWEMLMRLRIGNVEIFGHTEEEYQAWLGSLRRHNMPPNVPSPAWSRLSVLWIASSVESAFARLREDGHSDLPSLACVIRLVRQGDTVKVFLSTNLVGQAPMAEVYTAFTAFAERVRSDFLTVCPLLKDHVTLGYWFRQEDPPPMESPSPIFL